jgi:HK97 family phage prohead protease
MPIPKPKKNESHDDFIDRCMSDEVMVKEYDDSDQRLAVCETQWDNSRDNSPPDREMRVLSPEDVELRVVGDDEPKITGYAAKYGKWSMDLGGFTERIRRGAFDEAIMESDVRALKNHDPNLLLGRTASETLRLESNSVGLKFEVDVPKTTTGTDTVEEIRRGDLSGCSFAFTVSEDDWKYNEDGTVERTIRKVDRLFDVGPVTYPAYPDTTVAARSLDAFRSSAKREQESAEESQPQAESEEQQAEQKKEPKNLDFDTRNRIERDYRRAGRMIERNRPAES